MFSCIIHYILSDWVEVVSVIRLDFALAGSRNLHLQLLDVLKSYSFYINEVKQSQYVLPSHAHSRILCWLAKRDIKVRAFELHEKCGTKELELYLQKFGRHVQHVCPSNDLS